MYRFTGFDLARKPAPDESAILNFRHLLEQHELGEPLYQSAGEYLQTQGLRSTSYTIVDASIIGAPPSTKNIDKTHKRTRSKVQANVERLLAVIKRVFGFTKVCYRGLT